MCPVCGKALTRGVMGRVMELADRPLGNAEHAPAIQGNRRPYYSLIPLKEILGELLGTGPASKKVNAAYSGLIEQASELSLLMEMSIDRIGKLNTHGISTELLVEAIDRMRRGQVSITAGYDGEYGVIRVFPPGENPAEAGDELFSTDNIAVKKPPVRSGAHSGKKIRAGKSGEKESAPQAQPAESSGFNFDSTQQAIIDHEGSRALIIAGPGTGKTAVLAARIAKLIDSGVQPASILALSFTVKAAAELRERIKSLAGAARDSGTQRGGVLCATFHSFCCQLLREQAQAAGIPAHFDIIGEARRSELLAELCASAEKKISPAALGRYIEERKRFLLLPGDDRPALIAAGHDPAIASLFDSAAAILPIPARIPELDALYGQYRVRLNEQGLLDYDDLIAGTARLLAARQEIREQYRLRFSHIFVDEYQDINVSQYILLRLFADNNKFAANAGSSLWVIGDPNQAIYGFRGSDKRFIDRFMLDYPDAGRFELVRSFRCAQPIINAASRFAGAGLSGTARPVDLYRAEYPSDKSEAEGIARAISRLIGGTSFFAKDSYTGRDSAAAERNSAYSGYEDTAAPSDCAILIRAAALAEPIIKALTAHGIPYNFCGEQPWWEEEPFKSFLDTIRASGAPEEVFQKGKNDARLARLVELAEMAGGITPLLDALAVSDSGGIPEYNREGVHIMTIHAAKGLEFDHVFVPGCEDRILPFTLFGEDRPDLIDEERRLLYVAMTRTRVGLALSWARRRSFRGRIIESQMSPFLNQLEKIIPLVEVKRPAKKSEQLSLF
jgi:superfamily I DNA/RNA helicase